MQHILAPVAARLVRGSWPNPVATPIGRAKYPLRGAPEWVQTWGIFMSEPMSERIIKMLKTAFFGVFKTPKKHVFPGCMQQLHKSVASFSACFRKGSGWFT